MRNRERFNAQVDENKEKEFTKRINDVRTIIKKLSKDLDSTSAVIEPCEYMLIWGSLWRCLTCIESSIMLVSNGYIGSANALLRQMFEFLMWSKLGIEADEATLIKLNTFFYDTSLGKSHPVTSILKHTRIEDIDAEDTGAKLREACRVQYHKYSFTTHATSVAQQNPYKIDGYYELLNRFLTEICIILDTFLIVFKQYCDKVFNIFNKESHDKHFDIFEIKTEEDKQLGALCLASFRASEIQPMISKYHRHLVDTQGNIGSKLQLSFVAKWTIQSDKIK